MNKYKIVNGMCDNFVKQTLDRFLNSEEFFEKYHFIEVLKYTDEYSYLILVREKTK